MNSQGLFTCCLYAGHCEKYKICFVHGQVDEITLKADTFEYFLLQSADTSAFLERNCRESPEKDQVSKVMKGSWKHQTALDSADSD